MTARLPRTPLDVSFPTGRDFLAAFEAKGAGVVRAPTATPALGEEVQLRARLADRNLEVMALCRVVEKGLEFLSGQEGRRDLLLALARGEQVPWGIRRSPRYPVMLSATLHRPGQGRERAHTINVSNDGLCVVAPTQLAIGAEARLRVWPLSLALMWPPFLSGRVTACAPLKDAWAVGVNLRFISAAQAAGWKRVVQNAAAKLKK